MIKEIGIKRLLKYLVFGLWDMIFRILPYSPLRVLWMKIGGADIAWSAVVDRVDFINLDRTGLSGLRIGKKAFLGCGSLIDLAGKVIIGKDATISPKVAILSHFSVGFADHPLVSKYPKNVGKTVIGRGSFLGVNAVILANVTVGGKALAAAGSVVTEDVKESTMVAGVPAILKKKIENELYTLSL